MTFNQFPRDAQPKTESGGGGHRFRRAVVPLEDALKAIDVAADEHGLARHRERDRLTLRQPFEHVHDPISR